MQVSSLRHLAEMVEACQDEFLTFEMPHKVTPMHAPSRHTQQGKPPPGISPSLVYAGRFSLLPVLAQAYPHAIVLDTAQARAADESIIMMHRVFSRASPELQELLRGPVRCGLPHYMLPYGTRVGPLQSFQDGALKKSGEPKKIEPQVGPHFVQVAPC